MVLTSAFQRIKNWFHNHTRGSSSGTGARGLLKILASPKVMHPWQAYLKKYGEMKLKHKVDEAWNQYLSDVPKGQKPEKTLFEIRNKVAQRQYEAKNAEVKLEIEEYHEKMKLMKVNNPSNPFERNWSFQSSIDRLPHTIQAFSESVAKQTGWNVSVIMGGPNPRLGGKITTLA